jgi:hypothetical protein
MIERPHRYAYNKPRNNRQRVAPSYPCQYIVSTVVQYNRNTTVCTYLQRRQQLQHRHRTHHYYTTTAAAARHAACMQEASDEGARLFGGRHAGCMLPAAHLSPVLMLHHRRLITTARLGE